MSRQFDVFTALEEYCCRYPHELSLLDIAQLRSRGLDLFDRSCYPCHFTASSWIVDELRHEALLIWHRKLGKWLQPGGHADGIQELPKVALREAMEETGLSSLILVSEGIFDFDVTPIPSFKDLPPHNHLDVRFLFFADNQEVIRESEETAGAHWFSLGTLDHGRNDLGIVRMANKAMHVLQSSR